MLHSRVFNPLKAHPRVSSAPWNPHGQVFNEAPAGDSSIEVYLLLITY
ncbi:MAG: hypothetical protein QW123_03560 [Desulfurococcaceae archaeon]